MEVRTLGRTGFEVRRIGFGGMTLPKVGDEEAVATLHRALDLAVNFVDTARAYGKGDSERKIGLVMAERRRECFLSSRSVDMTYEGMKRDIETSLATLRTDTIDLYEPHDVSTTAKYEQMMASDGALRALKEARDQGKVRHIGFTSHNWDLVRRMIRSGEFEAGLVTYNLVNRQVEDGILDLAARHGVGLFAMKVFGNGRLLPLKPPGEDRCPTVEECLRFALAQARLPLILTGVKSPAEIEQNVRIAEALPPLGPRERRDLRAFGDRLGRGYCWGCEYCMPCEEDIDIPRILQLLDYQERISWEWPQARKIYATFAATIEDCADCGQCEERCPQHLPVRERLRKAHERYGQPV